MALYSPVIYTEPGPSSTLINFAWNLAAGRSSGTARGLGGPAGAGGGAGPPPRVERGVRAAVPAGPARSEPINLPCSVPASRRGTNAEQIETYPLRN